MNIFKIFNRFKKPKVTDDQFLLAEDREKYIKLVKKLRERNKIYLKGVKK